jgi:hypothetical protein
LRAAAFLAERSEAEKQKCRRNTARDILESEPFSGTSACFIDVVLRLVF